jgi:hypothetical protein
MILAFATAASLAAHPGHSAAEGFDLAEPAERTLAREEAVSATSAPRNLDTRTFAFDPPELDMVLAQNGPRLLLGAMGGRQGKAFAGIPKLAHIALGWSF